MNKTDILIVPEFYQRYVNVAPEKEFLKALPEAGIKAYADNLDMLAALEDRVYAPGKWTINQILEHLMDTERIFLNRALRFARNDKTELPGYDENFYADQARSNEIPLTKLIMQYIAIRGATLATFSNFNEEELMRTGFADGKEISVLALGYIIMGHPIHHYNVIEAKYFPLLASR